MIEAGKMGMWLQRRVKGRSFPRRRRFVQVAYVRGVGIGGALGEET